MPSGNLLKKLFRSYKQYDNETFYSVALEIVQEEKQKNHNILARDLLMILENGNGVRASSAHLADFKRLPRDRERNSHLLDVRTPDRFIPDIILSEGLQEQVETVIYEYRKSEILQTHGLLPRHRLLFTGPPGCGKTLCSEVIAGELGLPLLYVRFDAVISSYLGETAANLRKVFEFASNGTWVIFFDEFDAIGKSRDNDAEHGELKRVVNTFLQLLDNFHSDSLIIAATNHERLLDRALWRRFDDILYFDLPAQSQIIKLIQLKLRGFRHQALNLNDFVSQMDGWSHSDVERICLDAAKISVLSGQDQIVDEYFQQALKHQAQRMELIQKTQK
jgi:SpoVK/Ycf46/Vps4 family AAA+-type ATPase